MGLFLKNKENSGKLEEEILQVTGFGLSMNSLMIKIENKSWKNFNPFLTTIHSISMFSKYYLLYSLASFAVLGVHEEDVNEKR